MKQMKLTLKDIAELIKGELVGKPDTVITGISGIKEAKEGDITFLANPKYSPLLRITKASAIITSRDIQDAEKPIIRTENPSLSFARVVEVMAPNSTKHPHGIHPTAVISKSATIGNNVAIGAYVVIEDDAMIGDSTVIYAGSYIGYNTRVGKKCLIYPHVSIRENIEIGDRVIIHSGAVIGSDGFGFAQIDGIQEKIPQIGTVVIEDDVEIGANVTIDRARFDKTIIGKGTKIDNLVQIAHNVTIGENCIIVAQTGISGSTALGRGVILAGQVGVVGHIHIGDGVIVAAQSGVNHSIPPHTQVWGYPAKPHLVARRVNACVQRLPELYKKVRELKEKIERYEARFMVSDGKTENA